MVWLNFDKIPYKGYGMVTSLWRTVAPAASVVEKAEKHEKEVW
jgi:hypothetical protein